MQKATSKPRSEISTTADLQNQGLPRVRTRNAGNSENSNRLHLELRQYLVDNGLAT